MAAVQEDGYAIQYITNPSEKVQMAAVKQNGLAIKHITNPSEEVQMAAVKQNGLVIEYITNPSEKVLRYLFKNSPEDELVKYIQKSNKMAAFLVSFVKDRFI